MTSAVERIPATVSRVLGDELLSLRRGHGWTRRDLLERSGLDIALQTLATYELGTRQCTVVRLWELMEAMEEPLDELVIRVMQRIGEQQVSGLIVDLRAAARTTMTDLGPFKAWARVRLRTSPESQTPFVRLGRAALEALAKVCGIDLDYLVRRLRDRRTGLICAGSRLMG
ncbi:MAG: helix-turn-helix transcriptional regulator [Actinophytocola sp.]|uniref:helix-turn-helix domain-containing protein n=1 Tax=Actinophytocola sp. TaxID=1872138 RepID=UPI003C7607F4